MRNLENNILIIEAILDAQPQIAATLWDEWPDFQSQLLVLLEILVQAENDQQIDELVTELLFLGWQTPAAAIFRRIMNTYQDGTGLVEASRSVGQFTISPDTPLSAITPEQFRAEIWKFTNRLKVNAHEKPIVLVELKNVKRPSIVVAGPDFALVQMAVRYLNAGFFTADGAYVAPEQILSLDRAPYQLVVNIGPYWGPGTADSPFPTLPDELYDENNSLTLDLVARTLDKGLTIATPWKKLTLPRMGESPPVAFPMEIVGIGRYTISVDVFYHGHLLQSRRTEFKVMAWATDPLPDSAWPVQDGHITFTRTAHLTREALAPLAAAPRRLTILAERDASYQNIAIRVYDNSGDGLALRPSLLTDASLTPLLNGLRNRLMATMQAYTGGIGGSEPELAEHLGQLANAGYAFYRNLLPDLRDANGLTEHGLRLQSVLQAGSVIQIAPLSAQVSVPWELVYERPIHSQRLDLCTTFREHGPDPADCPHHGDAAFVCPHGFWGYRYIIEQLPCRVERNTMPGEQTLLLFIPNGRPLQLTALTYDTGALFARHWHNLRSLATPAQLQIQQVSDWDSAARFFANQSSPPAHLVYFYAHGGKNDIGQPYLQLSDESRITSNDLDAWQVNWQQTQPLVILNACESADYDPNDFENLILFFSQRGAAGIIGTQSVVKEKLANAFILPFFAHFLRQMPAGAALFAARRQLLYDHLDPRGLVYSLFAAAEVKLAQPIFEPEV